VGQFYGEFLKYTGGDKKALGIVLTPRHITELCALLANVNENSTVLDICAGTGGFLISAMHQMMKGAQSDSEKERIKKQGLIGIEQQPEMFALAASNMILRGDGKAICIKALALMRASSKRLKNVQCDVALLNPPFSQSDEDLHELRFIQRALDCLDKNKKSIAVAVAPISCAIASHPARAELLEKHTLQAVMSLPDLLFTPVNTITCLMVFEAHTPHKKSALKNLVWLLKNDGFTKVKHRGRIDIEDNWPDKRDRWVEMFRNREVHAV
jgi:type I restriction-modification system DNA methylase subunit